MLRELRAEKDDMKQNDINLTTEMIKEQVKKISNWKSPGPYGVQGYWLMKLTALHERIANQMDNIISKGDDIPKWKTFDMTVLCQKNPSKGNDFDDYRPISCFPIMWKLMTGTIAETIYNFLDVRISYQLNKNDAKKNVEGPKINY